MIARDFIICLRETTFSFAQKKPQECLLHLPCGCANPGQAIKCEDCPYLEACLSRCKPKKAKGSNVKIV